VSTTNESKLTKLLDRHKPGTVCLPSWLDELGISRDLQTRYRRTGWLQSVGRGAFKRPSDDVRWEGALYALQAQAGLPVHPGAITALSMQGFAHYARQSRETVFLFSPPKKPLPSWFRNYDWGLAVTQVRTSILPETLGLIDHEEKTFRLKVAGAERAILECLHLTPDRFDLVESFQVMEGLTNLRPKLVQELLAACTSVKVKRLFLYLAEKANHQWFPLVDTSKIDLGRGHRRVTKDGVFVSQYNLTVPQALAAL
jgi:Transcriptional regulator, AbiEi antitoxin, Type IV TA system/Transcriptional regulator, AbiEi antitoxin N-terminal domain